ncbi:hypothetical protein FQA39_LY16130 [Lamprigera yunnana]|nr:hypothetical protein FQA39_LY16130 [Lamprigera yunnana]
MHTMDKSYCFDNPADVEELRHFTYEEKDKHVVLPDENFGGSETEDHIETRPIDSDTDYDVDDEDECDEDKEAGYYIDKNGTQWRKTAWKATQTRAHNVLVISPGVVNRNAKAATSEENCWDLFVGN